MGKGQAFRYMVPRKLDIHVQKNHVDPYLVPHPKLNSKWMQHLQQYNS